MIRTGTAVLLLALLTACSTSAPMNRKSATLPSHTYTFIDSIRPEVAAPVSLKVYVMVPKAAAPMPAVVILHDGAGVSAQDWYYARMLNDMGIAALVVDSFASRGITQMIRNQMIVSEASILADAFAALDYLSRDPRIDRKRIGVLGFSKGGLPALLASLERYRGVLGGDLGFAAHVAFYPWCNLSLLDRQTTGAPIQVIMGERDQVMRADTCRAFVGELAAANPETDIALTTYPTAGHAFENPYPFFSWVGDVSIKGEIPRNCFLREAEPGKFTEETSGEAVSADNLIPVLSRCSVKRAKVRHDSAAAEQARSELQAFLQRTLLTPPATRARALSDPN